MIRRLQKRYALSEQGAKDLIKGCFACVLQNISFMFPVGLLYCMVSDLMNGGVPESRLPFYIVGCILCVGLILLTTYFQYNATYFATYTESGVRGRSRCRPCRAFASPEAPHGNPDASDAGAPPWRWRRGRPARIPRERRSP